MTRFEPTLIVTRVVVKKNIAIAYDQAFHKGVNIIRGENASGKSTILNVIFYGLGGDLADWSDAAKLCTTVQIEVEINGNTATLSREISTETGQPMDIFGGNYESSQKAARDQWIRYPYKRSPSKESFSQALFRLLGIPEVANDISGNLTMNQILRLLYADQLSPVEHLFKFDSQFDSPLLRDAVGRLLCGAYDGELYQNELSIRTLQREFDSVSGELRSLYAVFGKAGEALTLDWIEAEQHTLEAKRTTLQAAIEQAEQQTFVGASDDQLTLKAHERAYKEVQDLQEKLGEAKQERDALSLEIADSAEFIASLKQKIDALCDSSAVANHFNHVRFETCPACYSPLAEQGETICHLCKTPFDSERSKSRIVALINDTSVQLKQSEMLQTRRETRVGELAARYAKVGDEWRVASRRLAELQRLPSTDARDRLRTLHREAGYLDHQLEELERRRAMVEKLHQLSLRKEELNRSMTKLQSRNEALRASQESRLAWAYTAVAEEIADLLRHDLRRQDAFEDPKRVEFDFGTNRITVDGQSYFSASSRVVLKTSFIVGLLAAAMKHDFFRHPRFCLIDTIEDKGMEPQRSHNIQMQIARVSSMSKVEHQIIFATVMIAPDLDDENYTVGDFSTLDDPTLKVGLRAGN
jgi:hypothetical protein